ncbi:MAG: glycosyltransferase [Chthoniobacteraceae bacterium]
MDMAGGSEFRAAEMATAISQVAGYQGVLLAERPMSRGLKSVIGPKVEVHEGVFSVPNIEVLYSVDHLLIINTDSRDFTTENYWLGQSHCHPHKVDLSRIRQMTFLFNFIVSPACSLPGLRRHIPDIRIIAANGKFFDEISQQERYDAVRPYPRLQLESPINPCVALPKRVAKRLRFGMHSLPAPGKWNEQIPDLVKRVNAKYGSQVEWDFMGMPRKVRTNVRFPNVTVRKEFSIPVAKFLSGIDVFVFFLSWKREEAWARSSGEALMSSCPVISTSKGGNKNQVIHGNTGFLCKSLDDFERACVRLVEEPDLLAMMRQNCTRFAQRFSSEEVARRFLAFVQ